MRAGVYGQAKTDARDAYVIADAALFLPWTLRRVGTDDETLADLTVLAGYDDDLTLLHVHPALDGCWAGTSTAALGQGGIAEILRPAGSPQLGQDSP